MTTPLQRMFILPPVRPDFIFGVLRRNYDGVINDTVEFAEAKLHPMKPLASVVSERVWQPTAARHEVLLPRGMPDVMSNPKLLCETYEIHAAPRHRDLAIVVKLVLPKSAPLHEGWEMAREFTREVMVVEHELPAILVMHAPALSGARNANPAHVHIIALARRWANGFAEFSTIARDAAHEPLAERWGSLREKQG